MASATIFRNFSEPVENKSLLLIMKDIQSGKYAADIAELRQAIAGGVEIKARTLKDNLPAFTPHATFKGGRTGSHIDTYSGFRTLGL